MYMACLDNTQAYNAFMFTIIKDNTLKYIWTCVIWVCYHQNLSLHELNTSVSSHVSDFQVEVTGIVLNTYNRIAVRSYKIERFFHDLWFYLIKDEILLHAVYSLYQDAPNTKGLQNIITQSRGKGTSISFQAVVDSSSTIE